MAILYDQVEFAAAPKTGSSWVEHVLDLSCTGRRFVVSRHTLDGALCGEAKLLTLVRHPVKWLTSCYCWLQGMWNPFPGPACVLSEIPGDFETFVEGVYNRPGIVTEVFRPYVEKSRYVVVAERSVQGMESVLSAVKCRPVHQENTIRKGVCVEKKLVGGLPGPLNVTDKARVPVVTSEVRRKICESQADFIKEWYDGSWEA